MEIVNIPLRYDNNIFDGTMLAFPLLQQFLSDPAGRFLVPFGDDMERRMSPLVFFFKLDDYIDHRRPNITARTITAHSQSPPRDWWGPVVIMKAFDHYITDFVDVEVSDLWDIQGFFVRRT